QVTKAGYPWIIAAMVLGATIGLYAARIVKMTQMPELVALMHSLVGLAAVLIGYANYIDPVETAHFQCAEKTIHELEIYIVMAIGGADMPVVISMLNSYSGWAAAATGFMLNNDLLIVTGALVGSSGAILSYIMCRAMNRNFLSVIAGGFGTGGGAPASAGATPAGEVHAISALETAELLRNASNVIVVPGYGMAVAQAQDRKS